MRKAIVKVLYKKNIRTHPHLISISFRHMVLVGDFGLATSSLAAVDLSDVASPSITMEADMTLGSFCLRVLLSSRYSDYNLAEVGTRLYIAPEVQSRRRG